MKTILVANRGEIACRILRTIQEMGLRGVAVYSDADAQAPHVQMADQAVRLGPGPVAQSYLNAGAVLEAARSSGADAIHPGYGFLSENTEFAQAVSAAGLIFVGPSPDAILAMGDKAEAKKRMISAGVPCVPGYEGADQSDDNLTRMADEIGYPLMIKAAAGGGGRGMRRVHSATEFPEALTRARDEAQNAFGSGHVILEKLVEQARHVEIQVMADQQGNCWHLGERDCSLQRRHQKVLEEAPCPVMTPDLRAAMGAAAVQAAQAVGYCGAGTVEFLLDPSGAFYFLEMNTRLQVEHPVTEMVTGLDLVRLQLEVAQGHSLALSQDDITLEGHAIEARLYAEDPASGFLPSTGQVTLWQPPHGPGVRVDAGISQGQEVSPYYDPMLAKLIVHAPTRQESRAKLRRALAETGLMGVSHNLGFLRDLVDLPEFAAGDATTGLLDTLYAQGVPAPAPAPELTAIAAALLMTTRQQQAVEWARGIAPELLGWTSGPVQRIPLTLKQGEDSHTITVAARGEQWDVTLSEATHAVTLLSQSVGHVVADVSGRRFSLWAEAQPDLVTLSFEGHLWRFEVPRSGQAVADGSDGRVLAPMPGQVAALAVTVGQEVAKGDLLAVVEAMKMQHQITAPVAGKVEAVLCKVGAQVTQGAVLIELAPEA